MTTPLSLDPISSEIVVHTFAKGLLSTLAHDLELRATVRRGEGTPGDAASFSAEVPTAEIRVAGVMKRGHLDTNVLSAGDVRDIEHKIRNESLAGTEAIKLEGKVSGGKASITVATARGRTTVTAPVTIDARANETVASGDVTLSLSSLGIAEIKGPLGAFKLADEIKVRFKAVFKPA